jgi:uncharacterized LabA/DUF88 family protein
MAIPRAIVLVDGENLVFRYEAMVESGRVPDKRVIHIPGVFVWHPEITEWCMMDIVHVYFYTSMVGDDSTLVATKEAIGRTVYSYDYMTGEHPSGAAQLVPVLFKKLSSSRKSRQVDINITIDMMRFAHNPNIQVLHLISGDGDYIPLLQEVMRHGKEAYVGALSSGLASELRYTADQFISLDDIFFPPAKAKATREKLKT